MIVLNLQCTAEHRFEGWFASTDAFEDQVRRHLVTCPVCASADVSRLPSAPRVLRNGSGDAAPGAGRQPLEQLARAWMELVAGSENVAGRFVEEARRIHYGEAPARNIRGEASLAEVSELLDEGIAVLPLPVKEGLH